MINKEEKFLIKMLEDSQDTYIENTKVEKVVLTTKEAKTLSNLIEKQQNEIDKLKSENQIFQRIKNGTTIIFKAKKKYIIEDKINKYYVSKNKIREKIEELEKHLITKSDEFTINVLKGLIGE